MEDFNLQELFDLWQEGKTFNDGIEVFLDCKKIKKDSRIISKIKNTGFLGEKEKQKQNEIIFSEYEKEILRNLYNKIKSKEILAIGYLEPIGGSDTPELIFHTNFPPNEISLEFSSILHKGIKYSNIRIVENSKRDIDFSKFDTKALSPGRSTRESELIEAYEYLKKQEKIDYTKSFDSQTNKIRKAVFKLYPEAENDLDNQGKPKNLSDKAIQKHLSPRFQNEKKTLK